MPKVAVLDYGSGNLRSAYRALLSTGADITISDDPTKIAEHDGLVVPGVGAYAACMQGLVSHGGREIIQETLSAGKPVLGICVGMQIFFDAGIEHGEYAAGLGLFPGTVEQIQAPVLPHMGWNTVRAGQGSALFSGIDQDERFYFVHSYGVRAGHVSQFDEETVVTMAEHGEEFVAAIELGNLSATQFHPEKSGAAGLKLLANWVATVPARVG